MKCFFLPQRSQSHTQTADSPYQYQKIRIQCAILEMFESSKSIRRYFRMTKDIPATLLYHSDSSVVHRNLKL